MQKPLLIQLAESLQANQDDFQRQLLETITSAIHAELKNNSTESPKLKLYTTSDAARILQVSKSTIINLRNSGQLKFLKIGDSVRFSHDYLMDFIQNQIPKTP